MADFYDLIELLEKPLTYVSKPNYEKPPEVKLAEKLFERARSSRSEWEKQALDDESFTEGNQWTQERQRALRKKGQIPIVVNVVYPAVEQAKALLTHNPPRFAATAREDSDNKTAKVYSDLFQYIWQISDGNLQLKQSIHEYYVRGLGALMAYYNPFKDSGRGEIMIKSIDSYSLFIDPNCKDPLLKDASYIFLADRLTAEQLQMQLPNAAEILQYATPSDETYKPVSTNYDMYGNMQIEGQDDSAKYTYLEMYQRILREKNVITNQELTYQRVLEQAEFEQFLQQPAFITALADGNLNFHYEEQDIQMQAQILEQTGGVYHQAMNPETGEMTIVPGPEDNDPYAMPGSTAQIFQVTMSEILSYGGLSVESEVLPRIKRLIVVGGVKAYEEIMEYEDFPIVTLMNRHRRNPYPKSDIYFVRGIQEYINKIRSLIIAHASSSTNAKILLPRGSSNKKQIEAELGKAGTAVIEYNAELGAPTVVSPIPLPSELYKNEADARRDIQEILGIFALMGGDASAAHDSYKGTIAIDEFGQRRIKSKRDDIENALNQLARVIVQMIPLYYTKEKVFRLVQPNNITETVKLNYPVYDDFGNVIEKMNDVTVGSYDVITVSGSTLPSNRWAKFEYYMSMYEKGLIDQVEALKQSEVVDVEGVLQRFGILQSLQQQVAGLQEEVGKLEGDLQTADREAIHAKKALEVEKFKSNLTGLQAELGKAVELYSARSQDAIKEIKMRKQNEKKV